MTSEKRKVVGGGRWVVGASLKPTTAHPLLSASEAGFTLLELIITLAIIAILTATTIPVAHNMIKRDKEMELRRNLREMRMAITAYNQVCLQNKIKVHERERPEVDECYPPSLQKLYEGVQLNDSPDILRFLRRKPEKDPFGYEWGVRSTQDAPDSSGGGGENVFDVFSKAPGTALDGSEYKDW